MFWKIFAVLALAVSAAVTVLSVGTWERIQNSKAIADGLKNVSPTEIGRYQVTNPTPSIARNSMLLDTATGQTWVLCLTPTSETEWCAMDRSSATASTAKR